MDTIKLLEENICKKTSFYNSIIFLDQSPKAKWIKANISKIFLIKVLKLFAKQRKAWTEWKKQPIEWEKIFANGVTDKGSISKI